MHFIPDIYYSPVSMDFTLNWVNGAKRKSITSNELNSRLFNRKKPIIICVLLAPCTRGFIAYNGQSGIYNARKIDVNDQNIHLTWNISTWKRWNDWKSIVEKFVFFYWKKLHNLACISLKWDSTFQLNLIPTIWIHDMKSTWNRKVFLIWALKKTFKIWFTATNYLPFSNIEICISLECWTFTWSWSWSCNSTA